MDLIDGSRGIRGSSVGSPSLITEMLEFSARHKIEALTELMPMHDAARDNLLLERQHAQRNIHADAALRVPQQDHAIPARKQLCIGDARLKAQFSGNLQ